MTTDKSSEREAFVYWWRHKYSAADLEGIPEHVALNAAWAAWQARAALPQQAQEALTEAYAEGRGDQFEDDCAIVRDLFDELNDVDVLKDGFINTTRVREVLSHFDVPAPVEAWVSR